MPTVSDIERDLQRLEADLKQLEAEYNMFFSGRLPKPPWETRARVEALVKQYDRAHIQNTGDRFRFSTLQSRFAAFIDLWDRGLRAREEGRPGPVRASSAAPKEPEKKRPEDRILHVVVVPRSGARDGQAAPSCTNRSPKRAAKSARTRCRSTSSPSW